MQLSCAFFRRQGAHCKACRFNNQGQRRLPTGVGYNTSPSTNAPPSKGSTLKRYAAEPTMVGAPITVVQRTTPVPSGPPLLGRDGEEVHGKAQVRRMMRAVQTCPSVSSSQATCPASACTAGTTSGSLLPGPCNHTTLPASSNELIQWGLTRAACWLVLGHKELIGTSPAGQPPASVCCSAPRRQRTNLR